MYVCLYTQQKGRKRPSRLMGDWVNESIKHISQSENIRRWMFNLKACEGAEDSGVFDLLFHLATLFYPPFFP